MNGIRLVALAVALTIAGGGTARAQDADAFRLDRYIAPPTTEDGLVLQLPTTLGDLRWSAGLMLDYAHAPLVLSEPGRGAAAGAIVEHRLVGNVVGALGITEWLEVHLRLPVVIVQTGNDPVIGGVRFASPSIAGVGDAALGASVRFLGERDEGLQLGLAAELVLPTATDGALAGDTEVAARGQILAAYAIRRVLTIAANFGAAYRPERDFGGAHLGTELTYGLGAYVTAVEDLVISAEAFGATGLRGAQELRLASPLEMMIGARYTIDGVTISGGVGFGITSALGVPDARALLGVGYAPPLPEPEPAGPGDRDGDLILDPDDQCPDEPEDRDQFEDENGCPDPDNDADGVLDPSDACVMVPEDRDGFEDENGCPDPDNDADGILDASDECPDEPEDRDGFEDENGCPDPDNDRDGFSDPIDACPNDPETVNQHQDDDGCPDVVEEQATIDEIAHRILFPRDRWQPTTPSRRVIRELATLLREHPEILRVRLEGHADSSGDPEYNLRLSERRADRVRELLIQAGVAADRLEVLGHGETRLEHVGEDDDAHAQNRRVVFTITGRVAD